MGRFIYDDSNRFEFDDRLLAHLEAVIEAKLRRHESFLFTWPLEGPQAGGGRRTVWVSPGHPLVYRYSDDVRHTLNPRWLTALMTEANSPHGLSIVPEPENPATAIDRDSAPTDRGTPD